MAAPPVQGGRHGTQYGHLFTGKTAMKISANTVVTLDYEVKDPQHEMVDPGERPLVYLHGTGGIFPKLEAALTGKAAGDTLEVHLEPEDAFGEYDDELVTTELLENLPEGVVVGMQLEGTGEHGTHIMSITEIDEGRAVLDGNHPLAGLALVFACTVSAVRTATPEELEHGHAHGDGGHPH
jgi:FKBP-type peptidyl-prolyl cis-trans isomerase SlyD